MTEVCEYFVRWAEVEKGLVSNIADNVHVVEAGCCWACYHADSYRAGYQYEWESAFCQSKRRSRLDVWQLKLSTKQLKDS